MARARANNNPNKTRYAVILGVFAAIGLALLVRLAYIQVVMHPQFLAKAEQQYGISREIPAIRGTIKSADGFELASTQPAYLIYAEPQRIENSQQTATDLADILNADSSQTDAASTTPNSPTPIPTPAKYTVATIKQQLEQKDRKWVAIARKIDPVKIEQIKAKQLKGIDFQSEQKRYYPEGSLASQILGFVSQNDQGQDQGYYGIEGYFDHDLRGRDGKTVYDRDPQGNPIPVGNYASTPAVNGKTITLTINRGLQYLLEAKLKSGVEKNSAEAGSFILMEPQTGKILAMANYPTFDPSNIAAVDDAKLFKNSIISDTYEPGSVIKSFTVATGIDSNIFNPNSTYLSAPYKVGDHTITTANKKYSGPNSTVTHMLETSDNTGAAQFALKIGRDKFLEAIHRVGFDRVTGITLQGETQGYIPPAKDWLPVTLATASFGQGISVTPIQLLQMMATIANQGKQMKPTIIESVQQGDQITTVQPEQISQVYSTQTTKTVVEMLKQVVKNGEFRRLALQGYDIAGKTSTSQIAVEGGYDQDNTITTFVGFAPAVNPRFIMLAKLDKPRIDNSAETVVPMWMDMAKDIFQHYGIAQQQAP